MESSTDRGSWRNICIAAVIGLVTLVAFSSALTAQLVHWDDDINILKNPYIQKLDRQSLAWMFTDCSYTPRYRPLNWLAWAILYHFFGPNPLPYHALTLVLHCVNAAFLFVVIVKLMQWARGTRLSALQTVSSAMAALVWALHPLRVEAVAWVNCQIYTQSLFFLFIALLFYLRATQQGKPMGSAAYWCAISFYLCSLLTYPAAVGFVVVLLAIDFFPLRRFDRAKLFSRSNSALLIEKIPFAVLAALIAGVALWARNNATQMWSEISDSGRLGLLDQAAQAFYIWAYYLWKSLFALNLAPVYTQLVKFQWSQWPFIASAALVIGVSVVLVALRRKHPVLLAVWLCYLALLVPMLGLTEHPHYPNDRYSYIVSTLFSVLLAFGLLAISQHRLAKWIYSTVGIAVICLSAASAQQTRIWRDSHTLFNYVLATLGNDPYRADVLWRLGRVHADQGKLDKAMAAYSDSLKVQPTFTKAHIDLATIFVHTGRTNEAITHYHEALRVKPNDPLANYNLGVVMESRGNVGEALELFQRAVDAEPNNADYRLAFAKALTRVGKSTEAWPQFEAALKLRPDSAEALCRVGSALAEQQRMAEAIDHFQRAIRSNPAHAEAHYNLGTAYAVTGRVADATAHFLEAARLTPQSSQAHFACGMALSETGRSHEAVESYRAALKVQPDLMPAIVNLGWLLSANRDPKVRNGEEAVALAQKAVQIAGGKHPEAYDLLAAAYAEAGKWPEAVEAAQRASTLATTSGRADLTADLERKLKLYQSGQPLRL